MCVNLEKRVSIEMVLDYIMKKCTIDTRGIICADSSLSDYPLLSSPRSL